MIEPYNELKILYTASYNIIGNKLKDHTTTGLIEINRNNITEYTKNSDQYGLEIGNKIFGVFQNDFNQTQNLFYYNILREKIDFTFVKKEINLIDPKVIIQTKYKKWETTDEKLFGKKFSTFLNLYIKGLNQTINFESEPSIILNSEAKKYYALKKIEDQVLIKNVNYEVSSITQTEYSHTKNVVKESLNGVKGILFNPLNKGNVIFNRKINYNSNLININYSVSDKYIDSYKINNLNFSEKLFNNVVIEYNIDELIKIGINNKVKIIEFI
ncbi:hypothetical protein [Spiroplasma taiwanense]|uniref:Uncharacterized protein n=1 Tax=Spiroplasma taiwanense CT-1 TaxID=1276220 RepID=S5LYA7_9MOLU|nr:hypothetical protein [Spiroplasma taiwanense]AGR41571.1 hypothetical protein STAIW_v1c09850 [Spiroplasma taiwanense CT-1]